MRGVNAGIGTLWRFFDRRHVQKKTAHAAEQQRCDVKEGQLEFDPAKLIFIDETSASTKMARLYGGAPRGERCLAAIPHGHWKTTGFVTPT